MGVLRDCPGCKEVYGGSLVGAWAQNANPKNKVGYFGGYCECGAKLSESYDWEGILDDKKKVYASEYLKWRDSLSASQFRRIFGGKKGATVCQFSYYEIFKAKNREKAEEKFLVLYKQMQKDVAGKARLFRGSCYYRAPGEYYADYQMRTVRDTAEVEDYLRGKRKWLEVRAPHF